MNMFPRLVDRDIVRLVGCTRGFPVNQAASSFIFAPIIAWLWIWLAEANRSLDTGEICHWQSCVWLGFLALLGDPERSGSVRHGAGLLSS